MNSVKLNKKHLFFIFLTLVLLFSLNLNTFASVIDNTFSFSDKPFECLNYDYFTDYSNSVIRSTGSYNNLTYTKYSFNSSISSNRKYFFTIIPLTEFYIDTNYKYDFYTECNTDYVLTVTLDYYSGADKVKSSTVFSKSFKSNTSSSSGYLINHHTGSILIDKSINADSYNLFFNFYDTENSPYMSNLWVYDISFTADSPYVGKPITPADTSGLESIMGDYDNTINDLPSVKDYDLNFFTDVNLDSYTSAMDFVKDMFTNFMAMSGLNAVLVFALCIGLTTYILGRKVG